MKIIRLATVTILPAALALACSPQADRQMDARIDDSPARLPVESGPPVNADQVGELLVTASYNPDDLINLRNSYGVEEREFITGCMQRLLIAAAQRAGEVYETQRRIDFEMAQIIPGSRPSQAASNEYLGVMIDGNIVRTVFEDQTDLQSNSFYQLRKLSLDTLHQWAPWVKETTGVDYYKIIDEFRPTHHQLYTIMVQHACF